MPQSLAKILVHVVFSTKNREPMIACEIRPALHAYIGEQEEHHRHLSFQEEFRRLLDRYGIAYDERYVWD